MLQFPLCVVVIVIGLFPVVGEGRTDFSGTWKMDLPRSESAHQGTPIGPVTLVITQTVREVSILTDAKSTEKLTYPLDGGESTMNESSANPVKVKAHWEGTRLVVETARNINDATVTTISVLALDPSGKEMTIKRTLTVQHGYQSQGAKNTGTGTDVFVKAKN